jgi:putative membrane protein
MELLNQAGLIVMPAFQSADGSLRPDTCRSITDLVSLSLGCSAVVFHRWFGTLLFQLLFPEFLSSIFLTSCYTSPASNSEERENMIPRYNDLAANERTYLAWMRTSLALIAFGFLLERFDLVVRAFARSMTDGKFQMTSPLGREAGIVLVALGLLIMILSTWRFTTTTRLIKSETQETYGIRSVLLTGAIFILLAIFVLLYVTKLLNPA